MPGCIPKLVETLSEEGKWHEEGVMKQVIENDKRLAALKNMHRPTEF